MKTPLHIITSEVWVYLFHLGSPSSFYNMSSLEIEIANVTITLIDLSFCYYVMFFITISSGGARMNTGESLQ